MINLARFRSRGFELGFFFQLLRSSFPMSIFPTTQGSRSRFVVIGFFLVERSSYVEFAEYFHQVTDLDIFERMHGILDVLARFLSSMISRQLIELRLDLFPGEWSR